MKIDYAARARALVGTPFRLQGRGVGGVDCVGVAVATFGLVAEAVRSNYHMRGDHEAEVRAFLANDFRRVRGSTARGRAGFLFATDYPEACAVPEYFSGRPPHELN